MSSTRMPSRFADLAQVRLRLEPESRWDLPTKDIMRAILDVALYVSNTAHGGQLHHSKLIYASAA